LYKKYYFHRSLEIKQQVKGNDDWACNAGILVMVAVTRKA
jgi:hypothetical protein